MKSCAELLELRATFIKAQDEFLSALTDIAKEKGYDVTTPTPSAQFPSPASLSAFVKIEILRVAKRPGREPGGRQWTRYGIEFRTDEMDGTEWLNTFSAPLGDKAVKIGNAGRAAVAAWKKGKVFNGKPSLELIEIEPA